ncbi:hypothetical protein [Thiohalophilus sp.]|uniref:hypothetical protein n=1 Tax=Thiohalophilus sp. TaxID=3028392 RepID=UPI002ACDB25D|nr:hypothetical protein [Thiohalophilus sp.]MDZ7661328.1 hypothetical protein [Thiohalophilus sp.]
MTMSLRLLEYLEWKSVDYELLHHAFVTGSLRTAAMAHIPGRQIAKPVVLKDEQGYLVAVIPASHKLDLERTQPRSAPQAEPGKRKGDRQTVRRLLQRRGPARRRGLRLRGRRGRNPGSLP